jgi:hypothetical protein
MALRPSTAKKAGSDMSGINKTSSAAQGSIMWEDLYTMLVGVVDFEVMEGIKKVVDWVKIPNMEIVNTMKGAAVLELLAVRVDFKVEAQEPRWP